MRKGVKKKKKSLARPVSAKYGQNDRHSRFSFFLQSTQQNCQTVTLV